MFVTLKVLNEIKKLREKEENEAELRLRKALDNKGFKELYLKLKSLNFDIAKNEFLGKNVYSIKKEYFLVKKEAEKELKKLNMSFSDFEVKYSCNLCHDTGYVGNKYCNCFYKKLNEVITNNIGIKINKDHTFENSKFELFENRIKIEKDYKNIEKWVDKIDDIKYKNLLICGKTGVGKTYLVEAICNRLLNKTKSINFYTAFALNNVFLKYHTTFDETKNALLEAIINCDVLIIDDLGSEPMLKKVNEDYLYLVLNERLTKNKSTIVTTNLTLRSLLERYGDRTFSRICNKANTLIIDIENSDLRLRK